MSKVTLLFHRQVLPHFGYHSHGQSYSFDKPKKYNMEAIGAYNHKKDVSLYLLSDVQKEKVADNFSKNIGKVCNLNVTPFDKDDTIIDILIAFDGHGQMKEAVLGDIFWIGKITAQRVDDKFTCK